MNINTSQFKYLTFNISGKYVHYFIVMTIIYNEKKKLMVLKIEFFLKIINIHIYYYMV